MYKQHFLKNNANFQEALLKRATKNTEEERAGYRRHWNRYYCFTIKRKFNRRKVKRKIANNKLTKATLISYSHKIAIFVANFRNKVIEYY